MQLLRELLARDVHAVIETVDELTMQGRELSQLAADFTWYLRNLLLVRCSDDMEDVLDVSTENLARFNYGMHISCQKFSKKSAEHFRIHCPEHLKHNFKPVSAVRF